MNESSNDSSGADHKQFPIRTTAEGFNINGTNETSLIRSLETLDGEPISRIEKRMRGEENPKGFSGRYYEESLPKGKSLVDVLVQSNDKVNELGVSHGQLADFLDKFEEYHESTDPNKRSQTIEVNGRKFTLSIGTIRGNRASVFPGEWGVSEHKSLTDNETGKSISFSESSGRQIRKYGFYNGISEETIAEMAGLKPVDPNDPVVQYIKDKDANVKFSTSDHFERMAKLRGIGKYHFMDGGNYQVVPEDIEALVNFCELFQAPADVLEDADSQAQAAARERLLQHVDVSKVIPSVLSVRNWSSQGRDNTFQLFHVIPEYFPQLKEAVLKGISELRLPEDFRAANDIKEDMHKNTSEKLFGQDNPNREYFESLLSKISPATSGSK